MKTKDHTPIDPGIRPSGLAAGRLPEDHSIPAEPGTARPQRPASSRPSGANPEDSLSTRRGWWWTLGVLAGSGVILYFAYPQLKSWLGSETAAAAPPPARVIPVVTAPAIREDLKIYLNGLGTVTGNNTVTIRSRVEGELVEVAFSEGQVVQQGQLLAQIDARPFEVQLDQAKARLAEAQAALEKARQSQAREMAAAQLALDQSQLRLAIEEEKRLSELVATKVITANEWDTAVANRQKFEAQVVATKSSLKQVEADYGVNIRSAEANVSAAATAVRNAEIELGFCRIASPITGRIGLRYVDRGNMIRPTDPNGLAVVTQLEPIAVIFTVPQDEVAAIQRKLVAGEKLPVEAFDRNFSTKLASGQLEAIDNQVDVATGTVRLKAIFANEENQLFPNQFVNARLLVDTLSQTTTVPTAAVQRGPDMTYAYVVLPDSTVDLREIAIGPTQGDRTAIESGLAIDEVVVVDGVDKLQKGSKIAVRGQNPSGSGPARQAAQDLDRARKGS